jgi:hypothetical protein
MMSDAQNSMVCPHCSGEVIIDEDEWQNLKYAVCLDCDELLHTPDFMSSDSILFYRSIGYKVHVIKEDKV